jgi:hypothetical protein
MALHNEFRLAAGVVHTPSETVGIFADLDYYTVAYFLLAYVQYRRSFRLQCRAFIPSPLHPMESIAQHQSTQSFL